jgi:spermidine/putrescine transport system ATP-binding protein
VNTVFQSYALFPHMSVRDNVAFGLKMDRVSRDQIPRRVDEALALVGLEEFSSRSPAQLSGGQQQRVAVARALVKRPAVLLLDEPLGALDLKLRQRLQVELSEIHREVGTTFVYVTHDQEEAMSMADRIAVMNHGRIEQLGTPFEIYRHPASRFVADFIGDANFLDVRLDGDVAVLADGTRVPCESAGVLTEASLMVRPESLRIGDPDAAPDGAVKGRAVQSSFLGTRLRIAVETRCSDAPLIVAIHGEAPTSAPAEDTEVAVWWAPGDAIVLPADER